MADDLVIIQLGRLDAYESSPEEIEAAIEKIRNSFPNSKVIVEREDPWFGLAPAGVVMSVDNSVDPPEHKIDLDPVWLRNYADKVWEECVDMICSPTESGTANNKRFKKASPYKKEN